MITGGDAGKARTGHELHDQHAGRDASYYAALLGRIDAGASLGQAMGLPPGTIDCLYARAHARFDAGRPREAAQIFQALCALAPHVVDHWLGLGISLRAIEVMPAAVRALDVALLLAPSAPAPLYHRIEAAWALRQRDLARDLSRRFLALPECGLQRQLLPPVQRWLQLAAADPGI